MSDDQARHILKVFVGSPGDVGAEREAVSEVIARLNPQLDQIRFEAVRWELHPHLRDSRHTPQQAIKLGIPGPGDCEVAVFIFWTRIGTVLDMTGLEVNGAGDRPTGSTWEFYDALESSKPLVLTYRKMSPPPYNRLTLDEDELETVNEQERGLRQFFKSLRGSNGEYKHYTHSFTDLAEFKSDLQEQLRLFVQKYQTPSPSSIPTKQNRDLDTIPPAYLQYLQDTYWHIDISALASSEPLETRLPLIYVPALTSARPARQPASGENGLESKDQPAYRLVLEWLGETSLYLPGHAGQGKTTFCQWLMCTMAAGGVPAIPLEEECEESYRETLPDSLAGRLPLLVRLSDFWRALPLEPRQTELSCHQLEQALGGWLDKYRPGGLEPERVRHHLDQGTLLLVLDGLDEVPESDDRGRHPRVALLSALAEAVKLWTGHGNRLLLTSRPYALNSGQVSRLGLTEVPLALLPLDLQRLFVKRWFSASRKPELAPDLLDELERRPDLHELRENPLLLTAICVKYHNHKRLPQDIHDLYQGITEQVLYSRYRGSQKDRDDIVRRLEVIALGMHQGTETEPRDAPVRDISDQEIDHHLARYADESPLQEGGAGRAAKRRDQLLNYSGLLLLRPDRRAGFFHWTFQDYFAAERLYRLEEPLRDLLGCYASQPQWHGTLRFLLARALANKDAERVMQHLDALTPQIQPECLRTNPAPALLLGLLLEIVYFRTGGRLGEWTERFKQVCMDSLECVGNPAARSTLFTHLATIGGDDRPGVGLGKDGLPDIDWVDIPAGPFLYGGDKQEIPLEAFAIDRYPITYTQFQAFVDAGGYDDDRWWDGLRREPPEPALWPIANRPRETVSWYEAMAFCRWLSAQTDRLITLPSEQQWEKAARGGDGREYPWGDKFLFNHANCNETWDKAGLYYLRQTSAVGLYPQGHSSYEVADMAGNVWEWCRDFYDRDKDSYVVRGGSWHFNPGDLRAALRDWAHPVNRSVNLGFRVVCVPHS